MLSLQFETEDDRNVVDAIADLNPMAITSTFPLTGNALAAASAAGIPQIHLGSSQLHAIGSLDASIGEMRVDHLAGRGHTRLAFAYTTEEELRPLGDYWLVGLRAAAQRRGLPEITVASFAADGSNAAEIVAAWAADGVTAICAQSDETAFVVLHGLRQAGLRCPDEMAVMGVNAIDLGAVSAPPLTSVAFDAKAIVDVAVAAMMSELGYPAEAEPGSADVATLIHRQST